MTQTPHAQLASITSMDVYRRQNSVEQPRSCLSSAKRSRNRGIISVASGMAKADASWSIVQRIW
jgi:hypothetical protein